jgi:hypothetical protein
VVHIRPVPAPASRPSRDLGHGQQLGCWELDPPLTYHQYVNSMKK